MILPEGSATGRRSHLHRPWLRPPQVGPDKVPAADHAGQLGEGDVSGQVLHAAVRCENDALLVDKLSREKLVSTLRPLASVVRWSGDRSVVIAGYGILQGATEGARIIGE